jgi:hypothetical protein
MRETWSQKKTSSFHTSLEKRKDATPGDPVSTRRGSKAHDIISARVQALTVGKNVSLGLGDEGAKVHGVRDCPKGHERDGNLFG